jgi:hypothetical protein
MPDDIIQMYLKPKEGESKPSAAVNFPQSDDIIKQYLKPKSASASTTTPRPPISGATEEESRIINSKPFKIYKDGPQAGKTLSDVALEAGGKGWDELKSGVLTAGSGLGDTLSGNPASGLGKIVTGASQVLKSPSAFVSSVGTDFTGSEEAGDKLGFVANALPLSKLAPYSPLKLPLRMPTDNNLNPLTSPIKYPSVVRNKALNTIVDKITSNGRDPQALADTINAMKTDSRIGPADTSPAVLNMAQKLFTTEGDAAKNYLFNTSKGRVANLPEDVKAAYDAAGGVPVNVVEKLADLSAASKKVGTDLINPALAGAKPVDISNTLDSIDNILKPGVLKIGDSVPLTAVKNELADIQKSLKASKEYDANDLHKFQSGLRVTAQNMLKSADGNARSVGQALMDVRQNLVKDIDAAAPGYKDALHAYKDEKDIADAFRHAHDDVFSKSTKMENAPEVTEKWFNSLSDHEKEAAREGARLAIRSKMGAADNAYLAGANMAKSEYNQKKLEIIFGKEETAKLLQDLEHTKSIKNTDNKIIEGSQTEMRRANDQSVALSKDKPKDDGLAKYIYPGMAAAGEYATGGSGAGVLGTAALAGIIKAGSAASRKITDLMEKERNLHLAKMSLPVEGPERAKLISDLERFLPQPKPSILSRVASKLPISP